MPVETPSDRELWEQLEKLEAQLDELAAVAWQSGLRLRIVTPGGTVPEFYHPDVSKQLPALRFVRPVSQGATSEQLAARRSAEKNATDGRPAEWMDC